LPTARSQRSRPKPIKTVAGDRVHTTTVSDLLANDGSGCPEHATDQVPDPA
jgi:hypothetical protein